MMVARIKHKGTLNLQQSHEIRIIKQTQSSHDGGQDKAQRHAQPTTKSRDNKLSPPMMVARIKHRGTLNLQQSHEITNKLSPPMMVARIKHKGTLNLQQTL